MAARFGQDRGCRRRGQEPRHDWQRDAAPTEKMAAGRRDNKTQDCRVVFDPQSDRETGFAFSPKSANDLG